MSAVGSAAGGLVELVVSGNFSNNSAGTHGGAVFAQYTNLLIKNEILFEHNNAQQGYHSTIRKFIHHYPALSVLLQVVL